MNCYKEHALRKNVEPTTEGGAILFPNMDIEEKWPFLLHFFLSVKNYLGHTIYYTLRRIGSFHGSYSAK